MDLLSRILSGINVRSPLLSQVDVSEPASIDMLGGKGLPFHYVVSGAAEIEVDGERHELSPGDLLLLPTSARHTMHFRGGGEARTIIELVDEQKQPVWLAQQDLEEPLHFEIGRPPFDVRVLSGAFLVDAEETAFLIDSLPSFIRLSSVGTPLEGALDAVWQLVLYELGAKTAGFSAVASRALGLFVVQALRRWLLLSEHPPGWARGLGDQRVRRALQAMYGEPGRNWTLAELAEVAGQSRSAFALTFRDTMDETPFAHLRRLRIRLAAARLHRSRKSMAMIAAELGYASSYALARAFKGEMGMTGAKYRRQKRTQQFQTGKLTEKSTSFSS